MNNSESMDIIDENGLTFKEVLKNMKKNISKDIIDNISEETCFVCLLHLANEKSK